MKSKSLYSVLIQNSFIFHILSHIFNYKFLLYQICYLSRNYYATIFPICFCSDTQSYVLNFHGRVTQASVKNFQIVPDNDGWWTFSTLHFILS